MQKRQTQQRRRQLLELLADQGEVTVEAMASHFGTSEVTIRKDFSALEQNGLLVRKFGGAQRVARETAPDNPLSPAKRAIARAATGFIKDHARIVVDNGSTTAAMLDMLNPFRGLVVMTNSLEAAQQLLALENEPTVLLTGGTWDPQSHSLQGAMAEQMLSAYDFDCAFVGAAGLDTTRGTTTFNELRSLTQAMARSAKQVIVMAESDKLRRKIPNLELGWQQIDVLVTDQGIGTADKQQIAAQGVDICLAPATKNGE